MFSDIVHYGEILIDYHVFICYNYLMYSIMKHFNTLDGMLKN